MRFATGPKVTDAVRWSADPTHLREISRFLADSNPSPEVEAAFEELFSKLETPSGRANFCEGLEQWVRRTCL